MIDALQRLKSHLVESPARGRAYEILLFMVDSCLERPDSEEKMTFEADNVAVTKVTTCVAGTPRGLRRCKP